MTSTKCEQREVPEEKVVSEDDTENETVERSAIDEVEKISNMEKNIFNVEIIKY